MQSANFDGIDAELGKTEQNEVDDAEKDEQAQDDFELSNLDAAISEKQLVLTPKCIASRAIESVSVNDCLKGSTPWMAVTFSISFK
jgi:hypothetical protein